MNLSDILDLAIGLILVYSLFSLACSKINEAVASMLGFRGKALERGLRRLLDGSTRGAPATGAVGASRLTFEQFLNHDLVQSQQPSKRPSSYLHPKTFALGVMDLLAPALPQLLDEMRKAAGGNESVLAILNDPTLDGPGKVMGLQQLKAGVAAGVVEGVSAEPGFVTGVSGMPIATSPASVAASLGLPPQVDSLLAEALGNLAQGDALAQVTAAVANLPDGHPAKVPLARFLILAGGDKDRFVASLEGWFNGAMDRLSGWYKRKTQLFLIGYALILTVLFNVDSINIASSLYRNGPVRAAVAAAAEKAPDLRTAQEVIRQASDLSLPLGWVRRSTIDAATAAGSANPGRELPPRSQDLALKLLGLAITVGALLFGSTFWFDLLGNVANLRNAGPKPPA